MSRSSALRRGAAGPWPHAARDCRAGRVVYPQTRPDDCRVPLSGRAVGTAGQVPKAERHDHLPGTTGSFNVMALQDDAGLLGVCDDVCDALVPIRTGGRVQCMTTHQHGAYRTAKTFVAHIGFQGHGI